MAQENKSNTGCGGCLNRIFSIIGVIVIIILVVRGCNRNDSNSQENVPAAPVSSSSQQKSITNTDTNGAAAPSENPTSASRHPMADSWDRTVQECLDNAANEENYDEKMELYTDALYLQSMEYAVKFKIYEERGGKNAEKQPFAKAQAAEIESTLEKMVVSFGEDITAYIYNVVIFNCDEWISEQISDIVYYMGEVVDVKTAEIDDLWELFLTMYGDADGLSS